MRKRNGRSRRSSPTGARGRGVMTDASPHRIFLGVAKNRDDALKLSVTYQKENVDVYLKDLR